jgi:septum formation protein
VLEAAGLSFTVEPPGLDEASMRLAVSGEQGLGPHDVAEVLARAKAEAVSDTATDTYVIGADQILALGDQIVAKPDSMEAARRQLLDLRGRSHALHTAVAVATNGETIWAQTETATLTMRNFSPEFVGRYLAAAGEAVLNSVGAYHVEGVGIQLFETIDGDYFSILGLPLLPLLATLRREGVIDG